MGHGLSSLTSLIDYESRINRLLSKCCPKPDCKPWKCVARRPTANTYEYAFKIPSGYSYLDIENQLDSLYATCGHNVELEDRAGIVVIKVMSNDFPSTIEYSESMLSSDKSRQVLLGFTHSNQPIYHDFRIPHMLIAGQSGYGKTDLLRWIIFQLIHTFTPEELEISIIDMKGFSFLPFRDVPHIKVYRTLNDARDVLKRGKDLMTERSELVWNSNDRNITKSFKWHLIIIDEASQIAPKLINDDTKKLAVECDRYCADISAIGREASVGLFYCTQRPDVQVINPLVKANMDCKISFRVATESNSYIVLDQEGAEKLPHGKPGRLLYMTDELKELQVPYIGKDEKWNEILEPYQERNQEIIITPHDEGPTDHLDDASLQVLQREWESDQTSIRDAPNPRVGEVSRRSSPGDRKTKNMASHLVWTFPSEPKKEDNPPSKQSQD